MEQRWGGVRVVKGAENRKQWYFRDREQQRQLSMNQNHSAVLAPTRPNRSDLPTVHLLRVMSTSVTQSMSRDENRRSHKRKDTQDFQF